MGKKIGWSVAKGDVVYGHFKTKEEALRYIENEKCELGHARELHPRDLCPGAEWFLNEVLDHEYCYDFGPADFFENTVSADDVRKLEEKIQAMFTQWCREVGHNFDWWLFDPIEED